MKHIFLEPHELQILQKIFTGNYTAILFGSRTNGSHKKFSDVDICLKSDNPLPTYIVSQLKAQCSESNLPYKVDIIDYQTLDESFRKIIDTTGIIIQSLVH